MLRGLFLVFYVLAMLFFACENVTEVYISSDTSGDSDTDGDSEVGSDTDTDGDMDTQAVAYSCDAKRAVCTDSLGIMWEWTEMSPNNINEYDFNTAIKYCEDLVLDGHSDWRLPTLEELRSLVLGCPATETDGACGISDECVDPEPCSTAECSYCAGGMGPEYSGEEVTCPSEECANQGCKLCVAFYEGPCSGCELDMGPGVHGCYWPPDLEWTCMGYWSSAAPPDIEEHAWGIDFYTGRPVVSGNYYEGLNSWTATLGVRCVRSI